MIRTILVPLDGSPLAERALPAACRLARLAQARLMLVRVARHFTSLSDPVAAQLEAVGEAESYLSALEKDLASRGFNVESEVHYDTPASAIVLAARLYGADLIVMCTHGRSGLTRALLGSVAARVVHDVPVPVLLVRAGSEPRPETDGPYRRVLVPLDGSTLAETALAYVAHESIARGAEILLLHSEQPATLPVVPGWGSYVGEQAVEEAEREMQTHIRQAHRYLKDLARVHVPRQAWHGYVTVGDPADAIVHLAKHDGVDLIAMATHGRVGLDRLLHGSVAAQVLHHTSAPLLLLRGAAAQAEPANVTSLPLAARA